jgi:hypothetical protein
MSMNPMTSRGLPDIEITPEVIAREIEKARRSHDEFIVAHVSQVLNGVVRGIGAFRRRGLAAFNRLTSQEGIQMHPGSTASPY